MKATHAIEATKDPRTVILVKNEDGTFTVRMISTVDGEPPLIGGCRLSHQCITLLKDTLVEFLGNTEAYKIEGSDGQKWETE